VFSEFDRVSAAGDGELGSRGGSRSLPPVLRLPGTSGCLAWENGTDIAHLSKVRLKSPFCVRRPSIRLSSLSPSGRGFFPLLLQNGLLPSLALGLLILTKLVV